MTRRGLAVLVGGVLLLPGCLATRSQLAAVEADISRQDAWNDEKLLQFEAELEALRAENEALRARLGVTEDQAEAFASVIGERLQVTAGRAEEADGEIGRQISRVEGVIAETERKRAKERAEDQAEIGRRLEAIVEEVLRENTLLATRLEKLESSAFTYGQLHAVQTGETVESIARKYGVTAADLIRANDLPNANLIREGQELLVPGVSE
ncbi:MAG: LysM peptidoglycan-binding domain-containing protein [Gemmatimonadota bacterium]|jgi:stage VI sporulation protein D|nr:LysM peptidoglycan-binding domain-containing protein [Gemmatimonadota bacterium]MDP6802233.1 LysM peptidoglycan-binding domain-containing protein [Gemmatimonadota bacterium]MDP7032154.1 LysM peptidoglycan-binding domain-containing protein [Gemmatimonadota bacterium]